MSARERRGLGAAAAVVLCGMLGVPARAKPEFLDVFGKTYSPRASTALADAACGTCHAASGAPKRNPYGDAVAQALRAGAARTLTGVILRRIEAGDPDRDNWSSRAEIAAGTLPGDPASHPSRALSAPPNPAPAPKPARAETLFDRLAPRHSFHPVLVHFPIALFLFGGFCELVGTWKRRALLRTTAALNMTAASVSSLAAVATGFLALWREGFPLSGVVLVHLFLSVAATAFMGATALIGWRFTKPHRRHTSATYWLLLIVSLLLVGITGHFGGQLVYGP